MAARRSRKVAVEIKFSSAPKPARGFWRALQDLGIERAFVVAPVPRRYALAEGVEVLPGGRSGDRPVAKKGAVPEKWNGCTGERIAAFG